MDWSNAMIFFSGRPHFSKNIKDMGRYTGRSWNVKIFWWKPIDPLIHWIWKKQKTKSCGASASGSITAAAFSALGSSIWTWKLYAKKPEVSAAKFCNFGGLDHGLWGNYFKAAKLWLLMGDFWHDPTWSPTWSPIVCWKKGELTPSLWLSS